MIQFFARLIDVVFPPHPSVTRAASVTEEELFSKMRLICEPTYTVYTALSYSDESVRSLIKANKYYGDSASAKKLAAVLNEILLTVLEEHALESVGEKPLIVPTTTAPKRARERGRHQVKALVKALPPQIWERATYSDVLERRNRTSQTDVSKEERFQNIRGAFFVPEKYHTHVSGKFVIAIDDTSETGATMADVIRALKEAGARHVIGVALAK